MKFYQYKGEPAEIRLSKYCNNHNTAVMLVDEYESAITSLSINIAKLEPNKFCVDTNNCPTAEKFLVDNKIAEPCGKTYRAGFCEYPVYQFCKDFAIDSFCEEF